MGLCVGPVEKSPLVCEVHLHAQLEGPVGNCEALVHDCLDSSRGIGPIARIEKTGAAACVVVAKVGAPGGSCQLRRVAIIPFMDPVGTGSGLLSCRGFFSRNTPAVGGGDGSGSGYGSEGNLLVTVCYAIYVDAALQTPLGTRIEVGFCRSLGNLW